MQVYYPTAYILTNKHLLAPTCSYIGLLCLGVHVLCRFIAQMQRKRALFEEQAIPSPPSPRPQVRIGLEEKCKRAKFGVIQYPFRPFIVCTLTTTCGNINDFNVN